MISGLAVHNQIKKSEPVKKEQNVQAFVRLRPFSQFELNQGVSTVPIKVSDSSKEILCEYKGTTRQYKFDHVFDQDSIQGEVFNISVKPICDEVLLGFNGTIFVYGQTGTGKTHTMEGKHNSQEESGIIPRTINYIFQCLEQSGSDYNIRASHLEIYKEEIFDLLACNGNENLNKPLGLFDTQKGFKIPELEEIVVNDRQSILSVLAKSCKRRQTAETQYNKQSSRSHCIFSITVHVKETSMNGEDLIKIGKLNLVDLAGSENAEKSGNNDRLREAALINKSLLTLGKVITDLTNNEKHIPYRSSQLTKILQDSLGGKTKTSIIATISPSFINLDETVNTLEYALKAKNIKNTPQINQRMSKNSLLKEQASEIGRLKQLLQAAYDKNGVYLTMDVYESMKREIVEKEQLSAMSDNNLQATRHEINTIKKLFDEQTMLLEEAMNELESSKKQLNENKKLMDQFTNVDQSIRSSLGEAVFDLDKLHSKIDTLKSNESTTNQSLTNSKSLLIKRLDDLNSTLVNNLQVDQNELLESLVTQLRVVQDQQSKSTLLIGKRIVGLNQLLNNSVKEIQNMSSSSLESSKPLLSLNKESNDLFIKLDKTIISLSEQIKLLLNDFLNQQPMVPSSKSSGGTNQIINTDILENCCLIIKEYVDKSNQITSSNKESIQQFSNLMLNWITSQNQYIMEQKDYQKQLQEKQVHNNGVWEKKLLGKLSQVINQYSKNFTDSSSIYHETLASNLDHYETQCNNVQTTTLGTLEKFDKNLQSTAKLSSSLESNVKGTLEQSINSIIEFNNTQTQMIAANNSEQQIRLQENLQIAKKKIETLTNNAIDLSAKQRQCADRFNESFTDFTFGLQSQKEILNLSKQQQISIQDILPLVEKSKTSFKENIDSLSNSLHSKKVSIQSSTIDCQNQLNSLITSIPKYFDSKTTIKTGNTPLKKQIDIPLPINYKLVNSSNSGVVNNNSNSSFGFSSVSGSSIFGKENNNPLKSSLGSKNTPQKSTLNGSGNSSTPISVKKTILSTPKSASKITTSTTTTIKSNNNNVLQNQLLSASKKLPQQQQQIKMLSSLTTSSSSSSSVSSSSSSSSIVSSSSSSVVPIESPFSSPKPIKSPSSILKSTKKPTIVSQPTTTTIIPPQPQRGNIDFNLMEESDSDDSDDNSNTLRNLGGSGKKSSRASAKNSTVQSKRVALTPMRKMKSNIILTSSVIPPMTSTTTTVKKSLIGLKSSLKNTPSQKPIIKKPKLPSSTMRQ